MSLADTEDSWCIGKEKGASMDRWPDRSGGQARVMARAEVWPDKRGGQMGGGYERGGEMCGGI